MARPPNSFRKPAVFEWSESKRAIARALADGKDTQGAIATQYNVSSRTIRNYLQEPDFRAEVERLAIEITGIASQIDERMRAATRHSVITKSQVLGRLCEIANASLGDFMDGNDHLDWAKAQKAKKDHLITEVTVRRSKDGASRTTYKIERPTVALDLIADICGFKKQAALNPVDSAQEMFNILRQNDRFTDLDDRKLRELVASHVPGVTPQDLGEVSEANN